MKTSDSQNYYLSRIDQYWKQLGRLFRSSEKILPEYLDSKQVEKTEAETFNKFMVLLSALPDIGGDKNMLTSIFVSSAAALAYIRVLEGYMLPVDQIGIILNEVYGDVYSSLPGLIKWVLRRSEFSTRHQKQLYSFAQESQQRKYPENWVMEFVEGDGIEFDFGCDYTECAVLKFYQKMDAGEYMPYICAMDLTSSSVLGTGLVRNSTLYYGADCCDFRYKKNRPSLPGLPLEELPEYRNRKQ